MDVYNPGAALAISGVMLLLYVTLAAANSALGTITQHRLRQSVEQGQWGADVALDLQKSAVALRAMMRTVRLLIASLLTATLLFVAGERYSPLLLVVLVVGGLLLAEAVGHAVGRRGFAWIAPALAPLLRVLLWLTAPLRMVLGRLRLGLAGQAGAQEMAERQVEEEQRLLASLMGEPEKPLPIEQREMLQNIVELEQTSVREVMVPRPDLVTLPSDATLQAALETIVTYGHSRIPVYEESVDNIIGVLYAKDLFRDLRDGHIDLVIRDKVRPPVFVPTSRMATEVLEQLQRTQIHLAIVFDEYGGTAGLVTIEDILEEIVGEIQDEYDSEEAAFLAVGADEAIVSGRYDIDDLNGAMGLDLPTDENDTVGGLIYSALGRVPTLKDVVRLEEQGVTFRVLKLAGRRILKVRVTVERDASGDATESYETLPPEPREKSAFRLSRTVGL